MTRSIFDPGGGETEQSGSPFLGPHADNISHMPPDVVDGNPDADPEDDLAVRADELPGTPDTDSADVARRLGEMTSSGQGAGTPLEEMPPPDAI